MVLQQAHRGSASTTPRLDPTRILGISGTLALNVLALLLLLIPMSLPRPAAIPDKEIEFRWIEREKPKPVQPEAVPVVQPRTEPRPAPRTEVIPPPVIDQVVVEDGTLQAEPVIRQTVAIEGPVDIAPATPVAGMELQYAHAPAPAYPRDALRRELQGTVMLQVLVDINGKPLEVLVHRSSGHPVLDRAAQRHVLQQWRFQPATKDGRAVQAIGIIPIEFTLGRM